MTKIVRASLGLPTLRAGPRFQNSKPVLVIQYWNLRFVCNLVLEIWDFICSMLHALGEHIDLCSYGRTRSTFRLTFFTQSIILFRA